jgi:hypothetical protein
VPGQLFIDDIAGLARSQDNLHDMLAHFPKWAEDHYMGFRVLKRGVLMALDRHSDAVGLREQASR